jgi:GAF domain-containing protein
VAVTENSGYELPTWASLPARPDPDFDDLCRTVAAELRVPRALVILVSKGGKVLPGAVGLPEPWITSRSMPLSQSLSMRVVVTGEPLVVGDARAEPQLADAHPVRELAVVALAAMPLHDPQGHPVGALCAIDDQPRTWTAVELELLRSLAVRCSRLLHFRALEVAEQEARAVAERADDAARRAATAARAALVAAEAAADAAQLVARLSQELLEVQTPAELLAVLDRSVRSPLGAVVALLGLAEAGSPEVRVWATVAGSPPSARAASGLRLGDAHPLATAVRERRAVLVPTRAEGEAQFPALVSLPVGEAETSLAVPLVLGQHTASGGLLIGWGHRRELHPRVEAVTVDLARHVGHALDRVLLRDQRLRLAAASMSPRAGT